MGERNLYCLPPQEKERGNTELLAKKSAYIHQTNKEADQRSATRCLSAFLFLF